MALATTTFLEVIFAVMIVTPIILLWVTALIDVFRSQRSGWEVTGILVGILVLPIIGPLLYFAFRKPTESAEEVYLAEADQRREAAKRPVGGTGMYR
jgi:ABC-type transport system involved in cytochrome c biogenesis permease component